MKLAYTGFVAIATSQLALLPQYRNKFIIKRFTIWIHVPVRELTLIFFVNTHTFDFDRQK